MSVNNLTYEAAHAGQGFHDQPSAGFYPSALPVTGTSAIPGHKLIRTAPMDWEYRVSCRDNFALLPRLAGSTVCFNLNSTYSDAEVEKALLANRDWEVGGVNMTDALVTRAADGGGVLLTTAGGTADSAFIAPLQEATVKADAGSGLTYSGIPDAVPWTTTLRPWFRTLIKTPASASMVNMVLAAGLKLTYVTVLGTDNDQAIFRVTNTASMGAFHAVSSNNNTDEDTTLSLSIAASTSYLLEIFVDGNRYPYFYINRKFYKKGAQLKDAVTTLKPFIGILSVADAVAKAITVRFIDVSQDLLTTSSTTLGGIPPGGPV